MDQSKEDVSQKEREELHNDIERMKHVLRDGGDFSEEDFQEESDEDVPQRLLFGERTHCDALPSVSSKPIPTPARPGHGILLLICMHP